MKNFAVIGLIVGSGLLCACTYEGLRMQERSKCTVLPQSQAERCFARTRMTKEEYDTERAKLKRSEAGGRSQKDEIDPRYEKWLP
jgi:hypothetical protein